MIFSTTIRRFHGTNFLAEMFGHGRRIRARRAGVLTLFAMLLLVIAMGLLVLVINYSWLVLHNRDMQRRSDLLALVSVEELLDENLLADLSPNQEDDILAAEDVVEAFRLENNRVASHSQQLESPNVSVAFGRIENVSQPVFVRQLPYNSLRVELHRYAGGPNPARLLIRGFGTPDAADVTTAGVATLDNRVVGFRPRLDISTPVASLAIQDVAWFVDRLNENLDSNRNNRRELNVLLRPSVGGGAANAAFIDVDGASPLDLGVVPQLIVDGLLPGDLPVGVLGPAYPGNPVALPASDSSPGNTDAIVAALNAVAQSGDPRRVFAMYSGAYSNPLEITGFVAGTVLEAENVGGTSDQLRVRLEPAFLVHATVMTDAVSPGVPENTYIHKLRLVQ